MDGWMLMVVFSSTNDGSLVSDEEIAVFGVLSFVVAIAVFVVVV